VIKNIYQRLFPRIAPSEKVPWLYFHFFNLYKSIVPIEIKSIVRRIFINIALELPEAPRKKQRGTNIKNTFLWGYVFGFFFAFVVHGIWSYKLGTFTGSDSSIYYFLDDIPDLINFTLIVPAYVGVGSSTISISLDRFAALKKKAESSIGKGKILDFTRDSKFVILIILSISFFATINYLAEIMDKEVYEQRFWYLDVAQSGERMINALGIYHSLYTFTLFVFSFFVIAFLISIFVIAIIFGDTLENRQDIASIDIQKLRNELGHFSLLSILAKTMAAIYMINSFTWKWQNPTASINFQLFIFALMFLGIFVISIPRYYIETQWYKAKVISIYSDVSEEVIEYDNLLERRFGIISWILDATIFSLFLSTHF
jgi:hypothetical protein